MEGMLQVLSASHLQRAHARGKFRGGGQPRVCQITEQGKEGRAGRRARPTERRLLMSMPQKNNALHLCSYFFPPCGQALTM